MYRWAWLRTPTSPLFGRSRRDSPPFLSANATGNETAT